MTMKKLLAGNDMKLESIALANTVLSENDVTQKEKIICG